MIDRDQLREAMAKWEYPSPRSIEWEDQVILANAARLVADPDTLVITKVDGEWPEWVLDAWTKTGGSATGYFTMLDALLEGQPK